MKRVCLISLLVLAVSLVMFVSCIGGKSYQPGKTIGIGLTICAKETVESEIVKVVDVTEELTSEDGTTQKKYRGVIGVSCSLRNDSINDGKILAYTKSSELGVV